MDDNFSRVAEAEGFELIQSVGDAKANPPENDGKRIDDGRTVYAQNGKYRQAWTDGQYKGQYQYAE